MKEPSDTISEREPNPEETTRAPLSGKVIILGAILAFLCTVLAGYFTFSSIQSSSIRNRLDALKEQGLPSSSIELSQWYSDSLDGENAATIYGQAFREIKFSEFENSVDLYQDPSQPLGKNDLAVLQTIARADEKALALLLQAAEIKDCVYPVDLSQGLLTKLPHAAKARQACRLLGYVSLMHAAQGDREKAVRALIALLKASRSQQKEPVLISQLVRFACYAITCRSLHACLHHAGFEDAQLQVLEEAFSKGESQDGMRRAFIGERVMGADVFQKVINGKTEDVEMLGVGKAPLLIPAAVFKHDFKEYLDDLNDVVQAFDLPEEQRIARFAQLEATVSQMSKLRLISAMLLPAAVSAANQDFLHKARYRMVQLLLAIERFRLQKDRLPEKLEELVPQRIQELPKDPFSGNSFFYKKEDSGYVLYSVGANQADDGGALEGQDNSDEGFRFRRRKVTP